MRGVRISYLIDHPEYIAQLAQGPIGTQKMTEVPLAYGAFCAAYDWCVAGYFYTRLREWNAAWKARAR